MSGQAYAFLGCYIQRFSSTFGINNSPTNVELTLIPGKSSIDYDAQGLGTNGIPVTGFDFANATPGAMSGLTIGNFNYAGIIESYEENWSPAGLSYSVRMTDPRVIFDNVEIVLDGRSSFPTEYITSSGLTNYLDVLHYYQDRQTAEMTDDGIPFKKIRDFLSTSAYGLIYCWGKPFEVIFDAGFQDLGSINLNGIPNWYLVKESRTSLGALIQKVASDFNKDWYAYVDYDQYVTNPSGIQRLIVASIDRTDALSSTTLETIISNAEASGTLISYKRGKELRTEPSTVVLHGPEQIQWLIPSTGNIERFWGYEPKYGLAMTTPLSSSSGIVLLDHIEGTGSMVTDITSTIRIEGTSYIKLTGPNIYPPIIQPSSVSLDYRGYAPTNRVLDAALYSQETWETILWYENPDIADQIGVVRPRFKSYGEYTSLVSGYIASGVITNVLGTSLVNYGSGIDNRSDRQETLISTVYEATRQVASEYYGKSWFVNVTPTRRTRPIALPTVAFSGTSLYPTLDFEPTDAGWLDPSGTYPDTIANADDLYVSNNSIIKNTDGRIKAFAAIDSEEFLPINYLFDDDGFSGPVDQLLFDKSQLINFTDSKRLITPINIQGYQNDPHKAIVSLSTPLQSWPFASSGTITSGSDYDTHKAYFEFLQYMGYPLGHIIVNKLLYKAEENRNYGLFPSRAQYIPDDKDNLLGFAIPVKSKYDSYGPYMKIAPTGGGVTVIEDSSFSPWNYAGIDRLSQAGFQITESNITQATVLDSANFTFAGEPAYNIGSKITDSATITSISFQIGVDGVTTNYSLRTYALPPFKISKLLQDKTTAAILDLRENTRPGVNLDVIENKRNTSDNIYQPNQLKSDVSKRANSNSVKSFGTWIGIIDPSGKVNDYGAS